MSPLSFRAVAALLCSLSLAGCGGGDTAAGPADPAVCESFANTTVAGAYIGKAASVAASAAVPAYCEVTAIVLPSLVFQVRMPTTWNGKLHYSGGGAYGGVVPTVDTHAVGLGYVDVSSDSGHQSLPFDASFALDDAKAVLFGTTSVPTALAPAKEIVRLHYGQAASRTYFEGCSGGGREGLMMAQRFPQLFDGIIAGAPAYDWAAMNGAFNRNAKALAAPGAALTPGKIATFSNAVLAACDASDGLVDRIVSNPAACTFSPATLRCPGGVDTGDSCLSDPQLAALATYTSASSFAGGTLAYPGWALSGNESEPGAWDYWLIGANGDTSLQYQLQDTTVKNYLARNAGANSLAYVWDADPAALSRLSSLNDATSPDLTAFAGRGGKLIMWHGTSDPAISYRATVDYYQRVVTALGGAANAGASTRLYLKPGVLHCSSGPGADQADVLTALDAWVTRGAAPAVLQASKLAADGTSTVMTRPLCPYPGYAKYSGAGDATQAASFNCAN